MHCYENLSTIISASHISLLVARLHFLFFFSSQLPQQLDSVGGAVGKRLNEAMDAQSLTAVHIR
jgi:hypothetical protein